MVTQLASPFPSFLSDSPPPRHKRKTQQSPSPSLTVLHYCIIANKGTMLECKVKNIPLKIIKMVSALLHPGARLCGCHECIHACVHPSIHPSQNENSDGSCCRVTLETHMNMVYKYKSKVRLSSSENKSDWLISLTMRTSFAN